MHSDFGFKRQTPEDKTSMVMDVFKRVASKYDVMNDAMSFGLHRCWKDQFVNALPWSILERLPGAFLDMAAGTGDIAERLVKRSKASSVSLAHERDFILCDLNFDMLQEGAKRPSLSHLNWICANAEQLPLANDEIALYTIAFGLRNVTRKRYALEEAYRVLKPEGFFYCLELSQPSTPLMRGLYDMYSFGWVPLLGKMLVQDREAYEYLVESIRMFPSAPILKELMEEVGFHNAGFKPLAQGLVTIHWGQKRL